MHELTVKSSEGTGVNLLTWIYENSSGRCPSCDPVKNNLAEVNNIPFTPPNVDKATNIGTNQ